MLTAEEYQATLPGTPLGDRAGHAGAGRRMSAATRRGRWTYAKGQGWRLDGTSIVIDFDRLERTWYAMSGPKTAQPIDRYLDAAMEYVEGNTGDFLPKEEVRAMNSAAEIERRRIDPTGQWPKEGQYALNAAGHDPAPKRTGGDT